MELHLTPETEAKLDELARRTRRGADQLLEEAVDHLVSYNEWFERNVRDSQPAVVRGETMADQDVRAWLEAPERRYAHRIVVGGCGRPAVDRRLDRAGPGNRDCAAMAVMRYFGAPTSIGRAAPRVASQ